MNDSIPVLETERAVLTVLDGSDARILQVYVSENRDHLEPWEPVRDAHYLTLEGCRARLEAGMAGFLAGSGVPFCALDRKREVMMGNCNFTNIIRGVFQACTLGYSIAASRQGTGLMEEILRAGIDFMFRDRSLHRIMANHMPRNHRSERLLRKLGFRREGYARSYLKINGRWEDHVLNSLLNPAHTVESKP